MPQSDPPTLSVEPGRSGCPINMTMELLGDRWSLVVLRDIMFGPHRTFRALLNHSLEGIASNILSARLAKLTGAGLLARHDDPTHRQRVEYRLTEPAIELLPVLAHLGDWGARWLPTSPELAVRARLLADGGPALWDRFAAELLRIHVHGEPVPADGVLAELTAAYERLADSGEA